MVLGCISAFVINKISFCGNKHLDPVLHPCMGVKVQKGKVEFIKGRGLFDEIVFSKLLTFFCWPVFTSKDNNFIELL